MQTCGCFSESEIAGPELPDLAKGMLIVASIYSLLQLAAIVAFISGHFR